MENKLYILLPVHNRLEVTRRFIGCLQRQTYRNFNLILIDDGSHDGTAEMVREKVAGVSVVKGAGKWWWAGSLQKGFEWLEAHNTSASDLVLIVNDDTEFEDVFFSEAMKIMAVSPGTLLGAHCYDRKSRELNDAGVHVDWRTLSFSMASGPEEIDCLSTRALFLRVGDFSRIGGFYPRMLPHYLSDYEFTIRAKRRGMRLMTSSAIRILIDNETTGFRDIVNDSFRIFLKKIFSPKYMMNPISWLSFAVLASPWKWKFMSVLIVFKNFFGMIIMYLISFVKLNRFIHKRESIKKRNTV